LSSGPSFVSIEITERRIVTSVRSKDGNASTSHFPMASIYCSISKTNTENSMSASVIREQLRSKYGIQ
jgi:hypothetical protein